jgi:type I restriction enzyme M protein
MQKPIKIYIEFLKNKIKHIKNEYVKLKDNCLVYSLNKNYQRDISYYNKNTLGELGRAIAVIDLISKHKIPPKNIKIEEKSIVGSPSKRTDVIIYLGDSYNDRECVALVECKTSIREISDREFTSYFKRQLYNIAHSYAKDPKQPYPLVLITYEIFFDKSNKLRIFYRWFLYPEIEKILETGQVYLDDIIKKNSPFSHIDPPQLTEGKVYFSSKPLKEGDLIEIKDQNELRKLLKEKLHQGLRKYGIVDDDAFQTIINLLLAKTYDEISLIGKKEKIPLFQVKSDDYSNPNNFYNRIRNLYEEALVELLKEEAKSAREAIFIKYKEKEHPEKEKILLEIVPCLQRIRLRSLRVLEEDPVGDVFLDFMHSIFRQSRGLFFTHPNICRFVCKSLDIQSLNSRIKNRDYKYILDPSCGSGTFLIEALRLIFKDYEISKIKEDATKILFGLDNEPRATSLCKVNMVIHGDGSANIHTRDALAPLENLPLPFIKSSHIQKGIDVTPEMMKDRHGVDFIITNPPFSLEIKREDYPHFRMKEFLNFKKNTTTASECLFIERWYQLLNEGGKVGAVLPISIFDGTEYMNARLLLLCYFKIVALVGLPEHAFAPHAQQKTVLMFGIKRLTEESNRLFNKIKSIDSFINDIKNEKIIFYNANNIGYIRIKKGKSVQTLKVDKNDLTDEISNIIADAFNGVYNNIKNSGNIIVKTIGELYKEHNGDLILSPEAVYNILVSTKRSCFSLEDKWYIAQIDKINFRRKKKIFICETGDIVPGGTGIITPKGFGYTTPTNIERLKRKLAAGKFGYLRVGDIIIAPVRVYQKKIAVITKAATKFLFSKDFIVLRRKGRPNLKESLSLFLSLVQDENVKLLMSLSKTGKAGYSKIKDKERILKIKFLKFKFPENRLKMLAKIYDSIYNHIFT